MFEPYTEEASAETAAWIASHGIFADTGIDFGHYEDSVISPHGAG